MLLAALFYCPAALRWDMQVLAEEQALIQQLYDRMSRETVQQLDYIARQRRFAGWGASLTGEAKVRNRRFTREGEVPAFDQPNIQNVADRWRYGMNLGNLFTPGGTGFDPTRNPMPAVGAGYTSGSELRRVDTRALICTSSTLGSTLTAFRVLAQARTFSPSSID